MDKKELEALIRKIEVMRASMTIMQQELAEISSRLRFLPVSEDSFSDDDVSDEYHAGMRP